MNALADEEGGVMTSLCETCDTYGPELTTIWADLLELHRALHELWREVAKPIEHLVAWLSRQRGIGA